MEWTEMDVQIGLRTEVTKDRSGRTPSLLYIQFTYTSLVFAPHLINASTRVVRVSVKGSVLGLGLVMAFIRCCAKTEEIRIYDILIDSNYSNSN